MKPSHWLLLSLFALAIPGTAHADRWPSAQTREVFAAGRDHFVRIIPGDSWGDVLGFAGAGAGRFAIAEFFRRQSDRSYAITGTYTLPNPIAPVDVFVSNAGHLITIDNWHNRGYGVVVAIYSADGSLVRSYDLGDLFSPEEIEAFPHSASSINWHEGPMFIREGEQTLLITVESGSEFLFGLSTGDFKFCETREQTYRCRTSNEHRVWTSNAETPDPR